MLSVEDCMLITLHSSSIRTNNLSPFWFHLRADISLPMAHSGIAMSRTVTALPSTFSINDQTAPLRPTNNALRVGVAEMKVISSDSLTNSPVRSIGNNRTQSTRVSSPLFMLILLRHTS